MANIGQSIFALGYEYSPIILCNGIANALPGGMLPIIAITQAANFTLGILNGTDPIDPNAFFGHFRPLPGGTLVDNDIGEYPFANQAVAANAIIAKSKQISMLMETPANQPGAYVSKIVTFTALKASLDLHNQSGGTYTVATPAFIYTNCIMLALRDISRSDSQQVQNRWQFDFIQPLITQAQAQTALGALLSKVGGGLPQTSTAWSSVENSIGIPSTLAAQVSPVSQSLTGTAVSNIAQSAGQP